jgi:hypothetical protein
LLIQAREAKPIGIMKTLSGTFVFVALAVIAIITLPSCDHKRVSQKVTKKVSLEFGKFDPATGNVTEYAELKDKDKFDKVLCRVEERQGQYDVKFQPNPTATPIYPYRSPYNPPCPHVSINTDKITTSRVARTEPAEESSAYDPHAVYRVQSNRTKDIKQDIKDILDTFKEED